MNEIDVRCFPVRVSTSDSLGGGQDDVLGNVPPGLRTMVQENCHGPGGIGCFACGRD